MLFLLLLLSGLGGAIGVILLAYKIGNLDSKPPVLIPFATLLVLSVNAFLFFQAGHGRVWDYDSRDAFYELLSQGVEYKTLSFAKDGNSWFLLVKEIPEGGEGGAYCLRSKVLPPENFALIGNKPVAITKTGVR